MPELSQSRPTLLCLMTQKCKFKCMWVLINVHFTQLQVQMTRSLTLQAIGSRRQRDWTVSTQAYVCLSCGLGGDLKAERGCPKVRVPGRACVPKSKAAEQANLPDPPICPAFCSVWFYLGLDKGKPCSLVFCVAVAKANISSVYYLFIKIFFNFGDCIKQVIFNGPLTFIVSKKKKNIYNIQREKFDLTTICWGSPCYRQPQSPCWEQGDEMAPAPGCRKRLTFLRAEPVWVEMDMPGSNASTPRYASASVSRGLERQNNVMTKDLSSSLLQWRGPVIMNPSHSFALIDV